MKVVVTGATGQLGRELQRTTPREIEYIALDHASLELGDAAAIQAAIGRLRPDWILNAAAYTNVERAESEPEAAYLINAKAPEALATAAVKGGARLLQISTDFVFEGTTGTPYATAAPGRPLNVYGHSKWVGEEAVRAVCAEDTLIVRTAWVYSSHGQNFVRKILEKAGHQDSLQVVTDQIGSPTWARELARALWRAVVLGLRGTHHWTDAGVASWYDFAVAVIEEGTAAGLLPRAIPVMPVPSGLFPSRAKRPAFSVLDKTATSEALGMTPNHWRCNLRTMLLELNNA